MPKWLQGVFAPTVLLWLYAIALAVASASAPNGELPWTADYVSRATLSLILASWVIADAHKRQIRLCYDYDSFVFLAWPVVVPVYLFRTRGVRALLTLLCFAGIWFAALLVALAASMIREFAPR